MLASLATLLGPLIPVLARLIFAYMQKKEVDKENQRKFLEAVQAIDAKRPVRRKKALDALRKELESLELELDEPDNKE